jgi:hypothetical protein
MRFLSQAAPSLALVLSTVILGFACPQRAAKRARQNPAEGQALSPNWINPQVYVQSSPGGEIDASTAYTSART